VAKAAAVAAAFALFVPPVQATREPATKGQTPGLKSLWSQFPLDQARQGSKVVTTPAASTSKASTTGAQAPPASAGVRPTPAAAGSSTTHGSTSGTTRIWLLPLIGIGLVLCLGALALHLMRPVGRHRLGELTQWPRGLDLLSERVPHPRASTAVEDQYAAVRKLMEVHLLEGSNRMQRRSRDDNAPTPDSNPVHASYNALGDRITSILQAAEDAAEEIRQTAKQETEDVRAQAEQYSVEARRRADAAAAEMQAEAEAEADRVLRAAEERAARIEESAAEHRNQLVAETEALQELLEDRRRWLQEMIGSLRDVTGRLEGVMGASESDSSDALPGQGVDDNTQLDDDLRKQAHDSAEDAERSKDKTGDEAEDADEGPSNVGDRISAYGLEEPRG